MKLPGLFFLLLMGIFPHVTCFAQQPPPQNGGPWLQDLLISNSSDGSQFGQASLFTKAGGVPSVIRDAKGRLVAVFQWFPRDRELQAAFDRVGVQLSTDQGQSWSTPQAVQIQGFPADYMRPYDPTLTLLSDGRLRMYFTSGVNVGGPGSLSAIYSAVSSDGITYQFEPGKRFGIENQGIFDCAALWLNGKCHLYTPLTPNRGAYHAVSDDGLNFTRMSDIPSVGNVNWTGNLVEYGTGMRFYGTASGQGGIWWTTSTDGFTWTNPVFTGTSGGDPAVVQVGNQLLMISVGPPSTTQSETFVIMREPAAGTVIDVSNAAQSVTATWNFFGSMPAIASQTVKLSGKRNGAAFETVVATGLAGNVRSTAIPLARNDAIADAVISLTARDASNREWQGGSGTFQVVAGNVSDTEKPAVTVQTPTAGSKIKSLLGSVISVTWQASDNLGVVKQTVKFKGNRKGTTFETVVATDLPGDATSLSIPLTFGDAVTEAQIIVEAADQAGNVGQGASGVFRVAKPKGN
ncbi:MAG: glycoside hydrolase [Blastocatellia bacterium]|nr:glycoside hydrolase [Blastocatellia bacterium]